jgi:hypothetical protein
MENNDPLRPVSHVPAQELDKGHIFLKDCACGDPRCSSMQIRLGHFGLVEENGVTYAYHALEPQQLLQLVAVITRHLSERVV